MKFLGLEITKAKTAAEPTRASEKITVQKSNGTKPSIPLKRAEPRAELGDSGTRMASGNIMEEYNPELRGLPGVKMYDKMRRSDGTVQAVVKACTLPVRRATWFIDYQTENADDPKTQEIKSFTEKALFSWMEDMTWDDVVRQALISLPLGVSVFEKVYTVKKWENKEYVTLKKLAPRLPSSIYSWELPDKTFGIQQQRSDGALVSIPGSKLVIFVNEKEGDNWYGTSILRSAYKHWYYKDRFYNIDAMSAERQGLGVPVMNMPQGYTESDLSKAETAMSNLRANASAYLILPDGYKAEFMNMGASNTKDVTKSIEMHDKAILISTLTQFLGLGQTSSGSGSYALGKDQSDIFLKAEETVANMITAEVNKLIKELVDMNFTDVVNYPELSYAGITKADVSGLATAYKSLTDAGAIKPIDADESYWRGMLGLPALTQEDIDKREEDEAEDAAEVTPPANGKTDKVEDPEDMPAPEDKKKKEQDAKQKVDETMKKKASDNSCGCGGVHAHEKRERKFDDGSGYKGWRPLTFAEKKVTFNNIEQTMTDLEEQFETGARDILRGIKDKYMSKINDALQDGDAKAVRELEIKFATEYKAHLKSVMKKAYEYGKNNAATEMGVQVPANNAQDLANIDLLADSITEKTLSDIMATGKVATANELKSANNAVQSAAIIDQLLDEALDNAVINTRGLIVNESLNSGRGRIFENNSQMIYALQRSEILDKNTCNFCLSMDGRVIKPDDKWAKTGSFHSNCRGIWVEILKDEENPPEIGEIPENLGDYYGGHPNELIQPPRVMPAPGTLAEEYVKNQKKK